MQTFWSRAAQTRCRCTSCLHTVTTTTRRATTATSKRGIKAGDVFTACYSAMLATAAVVDAKYKDKRRNDWDRAIEEVRGGSKTIEEREMEASSSRIHTTSTISAVRPNGWTQMMDASAHDTGNTVAGPENDLSWTKNGELIPPFGQETLLEMRLKVFAKHVYQQGGRYGFSRAAKNGPIQLERNPQTHEHVEKLREMMARMILRLRSMGTEPTKKQPSRTEDNYERHLKFLHKLTQLDKGPVSYPDYSLVFTDTKARLALNHAIHSILQSEVDTIDLRVAKICWNLSISRAAPDITTFNILILHFTHLEQYDLANMVADTLLKESKFKPDESTIIALLELYIASNDKASFVMLIRRMSGVEADMRLKRRSLWHLRLPEVQDWALSNKVIHRNYHLHEKVVRTPAIFASIIVGNYKFFGIRRAIRYIKIAAREGSTGTCFNEQLFTGRYWIFDALASACSQWCDVKHAEDLIRAMLTQWNNLMANVPELGTTTRQWLTRLIDLSRNAHNLANDQVVQRFVGYEGPLRALQWQLQGPTPADPDWATKLSVETRIDRAKSVTMMLEQEFMEILQEFKLKQKERKHLVLLRY